MTNHDLFLSLVEQDFEYFNNSEAEERSELLELATEYAPANITITEVEKARFVAVADFSNSNFSIEDLEDVFTVKQVSDTCIYFKSAQSIETLKENFAIAFIPNEVF